jgi:hypothetical protein
MNAHTPISALLAPPVADDAASETVRRARALAARQLEVLERLAEMGMAVARAVERQAQALAAMPPAPAEPGGGAEPSDACEPCGAEAPPETSLGGGRGVQGLAMAYARVARAVRMTLALQSRVLRDLEAVERQASCSAPFEAGQRASARAERKRRIARILTRVIDAAAPDDAPEAIDALSAEASERLADDDVCGDALTRPMGEIIARICADLGLEPDWTAFAQEAWAEGEQADPRSPFAILGRAPGAQDDLTTKPIKSTQDAPPSWQPP